MQSARKLVALSSLFSLAQFSGAAEAAKPAKVSFVAGRAEALAGASRLEGALEGAAWKPVSAGAKLEEGDGLRTREDARVELSFPDGSKVRVGPSTTLVLDEARFETAERRIGVGVLVGKLWAKAAKLAGQTSSFEVRTQNAVAGVRGTSFSVIARADLSGVVKVYAGSVSVRASAGGGGKSERKRVAGPSRIDQKQWEEIIATAMTQVKISSLGQLSPAEDFEDAGEELEWAKWNGDRDKKGPASEARSEPKASEGP